MRGRSSSGASTPRVPALMRVPGDVRNDVRKGLGFALEGKLTA